MSLFIIIIIIKYIYNDRLNTKHYNVVQISATLSSYNT